MVLIRDGILFIVEWNVDYSVWKNVDFFLIMVIWYMVVMILFGIDSGQVLITPLGLC